MFLCLLRLSPFPQYGMGGGGVISKFVNVRIRQHLVSKALINEEEQWKLHLDISTKCNISANLKFQKLVRYNLPVFCTLLIKISKSNMHAYFRFGILLRLKMTFPKVTALQRSLNGFIFLIYFTVQEKQCI